MNKVISFIKKMDGLDWVYIITTIIGIVLLYAVTLTDILSINLIEIFE